MSEDINSDDLVSLAGIRALDIFEGSVIMMKLKATEQGETKKAEAFQQVIDNLRIESDRLRFS